MVLSCRSVAKDIGGSDPERMAPPRVEDYVLEVFAESSCVTVEVVSDDQQLCKDYPLFSAVNRCAKGQRLSLRLPVFIKIKVRQLLLYYLSFVLLL